MIIIPAIDIIEGKCVRLSQGDFTQQKTYDADPVDLALQYEDAGLKRLHLVDLDGARTGNVKNWKILEKIAGKTKLVIDFSGGISTAKNVEIAFNSGAALVAVGSIAVKDENLFTEWLTAFGPQRFLVGADVKDEKIMVRGWTESTDLTVFDLIGRYRNKGVKQFFCTDISRDGLLQGPSTLLYKKIMNEHPSADLIASGGVSSVKDLEELREAGLDGAIIGKALFENRIRLTELKKFT